VKRFSRVTRAVLHNMASTYTAETFSVMTEMKQFRRLKT